MYDVRPWSDVYNFIKTTGRVPISLSCGHTVCQTCLQSLQRNQCPFDQVCWLVSWLVGPFIGWVVGLLVEDDWFGIIRLVWACYLFGGFIGFSYWWIDWMIYWFIYWLVDWLIDWLLRIQLDWSWASYPWIQLCFSLLVLDIYLHNIG